MPAHRMVSTNQNQTARARSIPLTEGQHPIDSTVEDTQRARRRQQHVGLVAHPHHRSLIGSAEMRRRSSRPLPGALVRPPLLQDHVAEGGPPGLNGPGSTGGSDLTRRLSHACTEEVRPGDP